MNEEKPNKNRINKIIDEYGKHMSTKGIQGTVSCVVLQIFFYLVCIVIEEGD